jgi:hypothetical protein
LYLKNSILIELLRCFLGFFPFFFEKICLKNENNNRTTKNKNGLKTNIIPLNFSLKTSKNKRNIKYYQKKTSIPSGLGLSNNLLKSQFYNYLIIKKLATKKAYIFLKSQQNLSKINGSKIKRVKVTENIPSLVMLFLKRLQKRNSFFFIIDVYKT